MNPPSFSEEKLTAYALNELSPAERREVEAELANNPELKAELESIQLLAKQLRDELSLEAGDFEKSPNGPHRSDPSYKNSEPSPGKIILFRKQTWFYASGLLAVAACAALLAIPTINSGLSAAKKPQANAERDMTIFPREAGATAPADETLSMAEVAPAEEAPDSEPLPVVVGGEVESDKDGVVYDRFSVSKEKQLATATLAESKDVDWSLKGNFTGFPGTPVASNQELSQAYLPPPPPASAPQGGSTGSYSVSDKRSDFAFNALKVPVTKAAPTAPTDSPANSRMLAEEKPMQAKVLQREMVVSAPSSSANIASSRSATPSTPQPMAKTGSGQLRGSNSYTGTTTVIAGNTMSPGSETPETQALAQYNARREKALIGVESGYSAPKTTTVPVVGDLPLVGRAFASKSSGGEAGYFDTDKSSLRSTGVSTTRANASGESYLPITDNAFLRVADQALSTFSIDVDTGAYTNLRRFLNQGQLPPPDAVRIEELVNYFNYNYPQPKGEDPFSVNTEVAKAPWKNDHLLVRIGLQGKTVAAVDRPAANLVFLIDVSGSMNEPNKLPLVIDSMKLLVQKLKPEDRVGIAVYAGNSGMVLPSTSVSHRGEILEALSALRAGGSTNGAMGIQLAYDMAKAHFIEGGINRVILCTDGDFNVGVTNREDLIKLIEEKAKSKVFLSVFGFGMGNLQDSTLEQLANKGNGNYGYIDNPKEAKRVFVDQVGGTLQTIAKDVKIQVEFNPAVVSSYRLIGYENRMLAAKDFNDDKKDAGEIGAGHRVTALYEIVPVGVKEDAASIDPLKYQKPAPVEYAGDKSEIMNVKLRYKQPEGDTSKLLEHPVKNENILSFTAQKSGWFRSAPQVASDDFQFAAGVAAFGMILRDSPYKGETDFDLVLQLAGKGSADKQEDRAEFITLVKKARTMFNPDVKR